MARWLRRVYRLLLASVLRILTHLIRAVSRFLEGWDGGSGRGGL
jgi:hypothetical protein